MIYIYWEYYLGMKDETLLPVTTGEYPKVVCQEKYERYKKISSIISYLYAEFERFDLIDVLSKILVNQRLEKQIVPMY